MSLGNYHRPSPEQLDAEREAMRELCPECGARAQRCEAFADAADPRGAMVVGISCENGHAWRLGEGNSDPRDELPPEPEVESTTTLGGLLGERDELIRRLEGELDEALARITELEGGPGFYGLAAVLDAWLVHYPDRVWPNLMCRFDGEFLHDLEDLEVEGAGVDDGILAIMLARRLRDLLARWAEEDGRGQG